jgi:hypothetical protein
MPITVHVPADAQIISTDGDLEKRNLMERVLAAR